MSQATISTAPPCAAVSAACSPPSGPQPGTMSSNRGARSADDQHLVNHRCERGDLVIEDGAAVQQQRALVASAEARRLTAGQNRSAAREMAHGLCSAILS